MVRKATSVTPSVAASVRSFISKLREGELFGPKELMQFGRRDNIDQILHKMHKKDQIVRVAWGVYCKLKSTTPWPSPQKIAQYKAKVFGRQNRTHGQNGLCDFRKLKFKQTEGIYATDAPSSSFGTATIRIESKRYAPRKLLLGETRVGRMVLGLWERGKEYLTPQVVLDILWQLNRKDKSDLKAATMIMPAWMSDAFVAYVA